MAPFIYASQCKSGQNGEPLTTLIFGVVSAMFYKRKPTSQKQKDNESRNTPLKIVVQHRNGLTYVMQTRPNTYVHYVWRLITRRCSAHSILASSLQRQALEYPGGHSIFVSMAHAPSSSSRIVLPPIRTLLENLEMLEERPVLPSLDKIYDSHDLDREVRFMDSDVLGAVTHPLCSMDRLYSHPKLNYLQPSGTAGANDITNITPHTSQCALVVRPSRRSQATPTTHNPIYTNVFGKRKRCRRDPSAQGTQRVGRTPPSCGSCSTAFSSFQSSVGKGLSCAPVSDGTWYTRAPHLSASSDGRQHKHERIMWRSTSCWFCNIPGEHL